MCRKLASGTRLSRLILTLIIFACAFQESARAEHSISLRTPNTIPSYCQETGLWCGPAIGQMILEGYPGGVEHPFTQSYIWERIVAHRDDSGVEWATDPDGLRDTLMELGGDPGVNWSIFAKNDAQSLMYSVTYWMTLRRFPTAALVNNGTGGSSNFGSFQHWVVITSFTTDVDPTTNTSVNLQSVESINPLYLPCETNTTGGILSTATGAAWYSNYMDVPGNLPGSKWHGNFVAVIEPPLRVGIAKAPRLPTEGRVISEGAAKEYGVLGFNNFAVEKKPGYTVLRGTVPLEPMLVNRGRKGYYLVPFGYINGRYSQGAVIVNAYTGEFEEIGVFPRPVQFIERKRAIAIALSHLCACSEREAAIIAQLVFRSSAQTQSRFLPLWQITVDRRSVYVNQQGTVFSELTPLVPGD